MPQRTLQADAAGIPKPHGAAQLPLCRLAARPAMYFLEGADDYQVIGMSHQASDAVHLLTMLQRIEAKSGQLPDALIADAAYSTTPNLKVCEDNQLNAYISTSR
jgi:hypothetical protein